MATDFDESSLGDIVELTLSSVDKKSKPNETPVRLCNYMDVYSSKSIDSRMTFMNATATEKEIARCKLQVDDVLITKDSEKYDDIGVPALVRDTDDNLICGYHLAILRPNNEKVAGEYLYYALKKHEVKQQFSAYANGVTRFGLRKNDILRVMVPLPPLPKQRAIAYILGTLDDKIELNRRMNETLESMARALFKSWFVDFDPVIDNALAAGNPIPEPLQARAETRCALGSQRKPLPENTQKLFPDAFVFDEEMGWIPEGWSIDPLGSFLEVLETGRRPKGGVSKYKSGVPSVGAESIFGIGKFNYEKVKFVPEAFFEKMNSGKVSDHDVLLYKDGGKPGEFKPRIGMFGNGFPFTEFGINEHVFRMRSKELGQPFLYFQTGSQRVFHHFAVRGGKAAIPGINQTAVKSVQFLVPSSEVLNGFNEFGYPLINRILDNSMVAQNLAKLRDTLLPKLLSGELRVPEAMAAAEEALS